MLRQAFSILSLLMCLSCSAQIKEYSVKVNREYPHDTASYTQGLFFRDNCLYESTGLWGESTFRKLILETGESERKLDFDSKYFMEGSVMLGDRLYMLTWTNHVAFIYDAATLEYISSYSYPREGWGLTTDGKCLIASDGSSNLYFLSPDFKLQKTVKVTMDSRPLRYLNELEWIDGRIWANIYTTDLIVVINPSSGKVESRIDCSSLFPYDKRTPDMDVLNGIAHNPEDGKVYLTGKYWPKLFEVELVRNPR